MSAMAGRTPILRHRALKPTAGINAALTPALQAFPCPDPVCNRRGDPVVPRDECAAGPVREQERVAEVPEDLDVGVEVGTESRCRDEAATSTRWRGSGMGGMVETGAGTAGPPGSRTTPFSGLKLVIISLSGIVRTPFPLTTVNVVRR